MISRVSRAASREKTERIPVTSCGGSPDPSVIAISAPKSVQGQRVEDLVLSPRQLALWNGVRIPDARSKLAAKLHNPVRLRAGQRLQQDVSMTVKMAVFAPMPSARASRAIAVKLVFLRIIRTRSGGLRQSFHEGPRRSCGRFVPVMSARGRAADDSRTYSMRIRISKCAEVPRLVPPRALCWPLALLALVIYPLVWILLIPFRLVGIAVDGVLGLLRGIVMLPSNIISGLRARSG